MASNEKLSGRRKRRAQPEVGKIDVLPTIAARDRALKEANRPAARGRAGRIDQQVKVTGVGKFKPPGSFQWFDIGKNGAFIPKGSAVKMTGGGAGGTIDGFPAEAGTLTQLKRG